MKLRHFAVFGGIFTVIICLLAYYVSGNVLEPVNCEYVFSELVNPIFTQDGEQVKVSVSVKYLDQRTKATQISQFDLTLEKDSNWKIVK